MKRRKTRFNDGGANNPTKGMMSIRTAQPVTKRATLL
jgi:hypothetical protein